MKQFSIRMDEDLLESIYTPNKSLSEQVNDCVKQLIAIRSYTTEELKNKFKPEEWRALAEAMKNFRNSDISRYQSQTFTMALKSADINNGIGNAWKIDIDNLCNKIDQLTAAQLDALYNRIDKFWNRVENGGDDGFITRWITF